MKSVPFFIASKNSSSAVAGNSVFELNGVANLKTVGAFTSSATIVRKQDALPLLEFMAQKREEAVWSMSDPGTVFRVPNERTGNTVFKISLHRAELGLKFERHLRIFALNASDKSNSACLSHADGSLLILV